MLSKVERFPDNCIWSASIPRALLLSDQLNLELEMYLFLLIDGRSDFIFSSHVRNRNPDFQYIRR